MFIDRGRQTQASRFGRADMGLESENRNVMVRSSEPRRNGVLLGPINMSRLAEWGPD